MFRREKYSSFPPICLHLGRDAPSNMTYSPRRREYSVCGEWHAERPCGVEPWRRVRHEHDRRDLNVGFARRRDPMKQNVGFSPFPFFSGKTETFHSIFIPIPRLPRYNIPSNTKEN